MPITSTQIANYTANVVSPGDPNQFAATIWLFRADSSMLAFVRFYRAGTHRNRSRVVPARVLADPAVLALDDSGTCEVRQAPGQGPGCRAP
jgi:hypothetical protein